MTDDAEQPDRQGKSPLGPGESSARGDEVPTHASIPRLGFSASSTSALMMQLPWFVWSALLVWSVAVMFVELRWGLLVLAVWLVSGAVVIWQPAEDVIAKAMFRLRRPTMTEQRRFDLVWERLASSAGVGGSKRALWVEDSDAVTSTGTGGRSVAVTRWALTALSPEQLTGVIAHELSHTLGGRSWLGLLGVWYSLPARGGLWLIRKLVSLARTVKAIGCLLGGFVIATAIGTVLLVLLTGDVDPVVLVMLSPLIAPPLLAWISRVSEKNADKVAADLGQGAALIGVLYRWQESGTVQAPGTRRSELLASQPPIADRIRSLELYMQAKQAQ